MGTFCVVGACRERGKTCKYRGMLLQTFSQLLLVSHSARTAVAFNLWRQVMIIINRAVDTHDVSIDIALLVFPSRFFCLFLLKCSRLELVI